MKISKATNNINFGYNYRTHRVITQKAMEQVPDATEKILQYLKEHQNNSFLNILDFSKKGLLKLLNSTEIKPSGFKNIINIAPGDVKDKFLVGTMLPDLLKSETGFFRNKHFYMPPEKHFKELSYGKKTVINNALASFEEHLSKIKNGDIALNLGMALHLLQDVTVPMHTQRASLKIFKYFPTLGKLIDLKMHANFENEMVKDSEKFDINYLSGVHPIKQNLPKDFTLKDIFMNNVKFSTKKEVRVPKHNKYAWYMIQQKIYNRAVDSTALFLEKVAGLIDKNNIAKIVE